jgi:hypothetical protein
MLLLKRFYFVLVLPMLFFCSTILSSGETHFVPPTTLTNLTVASNVSASISPTALSPTIPIGTADPVLGNRVAKISNQLREIPKDAEQIWREYDITPYTKGRKFSDGSQPEQTIIDWILRQTGTKIWHNSPFGILTVDN